MKVAAPNRRQFCQSALALSIAALWSIEPLSAERNTMPDTKHPLPAVLSYDDVRSVSPALER